jgi:hypothetical protein
LAHKLDQPGDMFQYTFSQKSYDIFDDLSVLVIIG